MRSSSIKRGTTLHGGSQGFRFGLNKHGEREVSSEFFININILT